MKGTKRSKMVLLGDTAVGKSCIVGRFIRNEFFEFQEPTIGAAFSTAKVELGRKTVQLEIWDTAGQERYRSLAPMYYRGAHGAMVVYDITSKDSFIGAQSWVIELLRRAPQCFILLVGNKSDLEKNRNIDNALVETYAEELKIKHILVSAKIGKNVNKAFEILGENVADRDIVKNDNITVEPTFVRHQNRKCC